jgi:hypothetical protein
MKTVVRWIGAVIGLLVFVLLVAIAIGTGLPIAHIATCSAQYPQSPVTLFATVEDDASSPSWRSDVAQVLKERGSDGKPLWIETYKDGQTLSYLEVQTFPGKGLDRELQDPTLPFGGQWRYTFRPDSAGTELTIGEAGYIFNPVFRLIEQFFTGYSSTIETYMTDLGRKYGGSPQVACTVTTYAQGLPK